MTSTLRDPKKEGFWRKMVRRQAGGRLSARAWCRKQGLKETAFYWWRAKLARGDGGLPKTGLVRARKSAAAGLAFVPVRVGDDQAVNGDGRIEIVLAGQRRVRVHGPVDRQVLADVLAVLALDTTRTLARSRAAKPRVESRVEGQGC